MGRAELLQDNARLEMRALARIGGERCGQEECAKPPCQAPTSTARAPRKDLRRSALNRSSQEPGVAPARFIAPIKGGPYAFEPERVPEDVIFPATLNR
jgi:hypothetical protein